MSLAVAWVMTGIYNVKFVICTSELIHLYAGSANALRKWKSGCLDLTVYVCMVLHFGRLILAAAYGNSEVVITNVWRCSLGITECVVLLLFFWSYNCPALILYCTTTDIRSICSGNPVIMQLLNILLVLDSNVFHVTVYLVHCVLQFLFFLFFSYV